MVVQTQERDEFFQKDTMVKDLYSNRYKLLSIVCHIMVTIIANILNVYCVPGTIFST